MEQQFIVGGGVETADVDVAVARNSVLEALFEALHMTCGSEDGGYCLGNSWDLCQKLIQRAFRYRGGL